MGIKYRLSMVCFLLFTFNVSAEILTTYLTWQQRQTHDNITINYITTESSAAKIYYSTTSNEDSQLFQKEVYGHSRKLPGQLGFLNQVELKDLEPETIYYFTAESDDGSMSDEYKFQTLPATGGEVRFMQGGDMSPSRKVITSALLAMQSEPHVILIGGDIAYANGNVSDYDKWEDWFKIMNHVMITPQGFLTPMVAAIGNHEIGNYFSSDLDKKAPFFMSLFEQRKDKTHFVKTFSDHTVLFVLDSGHGVSHKSQRDWLKTEMQAYMDWPNRMAMYHVPLYPSHRSFGTFLSKRGRKYWLETFDRYGLSLSFENHDHTLKRTHMLHKGKSVRQNGTVYVGDGCWGRSQRSAQKRDYLKISIEANHVWLAKATDGQLHLQGMGQSKIYDDFKIDTNTRQVVEKSF